MKSGAKTRGGLRFGRQKNPGNLRSSHSILGWPCAAFAYPHATVLIVNW